MCLWEQQTQASKCILNLPWLVCWSMCGYICVGAAPTCAPCACVCVIFARRYIDYLGEGLFFKTRRSDYQHLNVSYVVLMAL